jgi:uncharacterized membrane protein
LPSGASVSFTPSTVSGQGTTTMGIATASSTSAGSYTLTITGSSGALSHSVAVKLTVNSAGDFSISANPTSLSIVRGHSGTYTVSVAALGGFTGTVSLKVTGLPGRVTASFNPATVNGSGSSVLTIRAGSRSRAGTYKLTNTGTSGSLVHSTSVTLVLK